MLKMMCVENPSEEKLIEAYGHWILANVHEVDLSIR